MKTKAREPNCSIKSKLGMPVVFFACSFFFLAGLFCSSLLLSSRQDLQDISVARTRLLESVREQYDFMPFGETGDPYVTTIPFQVLSWRPRAMYFPKFLTAEQCKSIIDMAKTKLKPSTVALRKGETADNTQEVRTSHGVFIYAAEDKTGTLDTVEEKIAQATKLPRINGEGNIKIV